MTFDIFAEIVERKWNRYVSAIDTALKNRIIVLSNRRLLYPNLILFTETNNFYLAEVFGAVREVPSEFITVKQKVDHSTEEYLYQFRFGNKSESWIRFGGQCQPIRGACFMRADNRERFLDRFPFIKLWDVTFNDKEEGPPITFTDSFRIGLFANCLFLNKYEQVYRVKFCSHLVVSKKDLNKSQVEDCLNKELSIESPHCLPDLFGRKKPNIVGVQICGEEYLENYLLAAQLSTMYLNPEIRETTIGQFLDSNPKFFFKLFKTHKVIPHPILEWIEGNPDPDEKSIIPDFCLQREDCFYDICDLKTIMEQRKNLTRGGHKRRRFIDYVNEGIAQLANYEDYFSYPANAAYAEGKYGIKINNPKLILVVGSYENVDPQEIKDASRKLKSNFEILDYDTFAQGILT